MGLLEKSRCKQEQFAARMRENGYETKTTFYADFTIAEAFGANAVKDTYKTSFECYRNDTEFFTELALVLNWKAWEMSGLKNKELMQVYTRLYYAADDYVYENWDFEGRNYYFRITD